MARLLLASDATLLDYFAIAALQTFDEVPWAAHTDTTNFDDAEIRGMIATACYEMAEAMMEARRPDKRRK